MTDRRQSQADALLGELQREHGGQLKVFLGAAPGVGKTYAMLSRAADLARQGVDVVAGLVETHGRRETAALLEGLEVLPRNVVEHRGHRLQEFDLDAMLARRPQVALVDELAHRNAPGSRHERRWQDVVELLDNGIDVYTTLNIQHLESLNDVVHRITGIRVSETVPDSVFDRLRDIVLVDLPPRELLERLRQGKVYVPDQAAQALQAFFSPSNLIALRELAMQTAADRVDIDLRDAQAARGLPGVPVRRGVLVAVDGLGQSEYLVRVGRRLAERRDAPWIVATVQSGAQPEPARQAELDRAFALARRLGGETAVVLGGNVVDALLDHAARTGASTIVIGRTRERPFARTFNRTLTQQLIQRGAHHEITIVATPEARARARRSWRAASHRNVPGDFALAACAAAAATGVAWLAERWVGLDDLSPVFIVAVVLVAARTRMAAAVFAAMLCFLAYNFFFIDPRYTLLIGASQGVATVVLFLLAALVAGRLASKLRMQVLALRAANAHATALQALSRRLAAAADIGQVVVAAREAFKRALGLDAWLRIGANDSMSPGVPSPDQKALAAADWCQANQQPAGRYTDTLASSDWWFLPVSGEREAIGVVGLRLGEGAPRPAEEQRRLAEAMTQEIGQAIVRTRLVEDLEDTRVAGETERLRSALLSSVSHDLRSPLSSILGAAGTLDAYGAGMDAADHHALLDTIRLEGERLDRYIQNLLDMTRLGHGDMTLRRDWIGVDELVGSAVARLARYQAGARVEIRIAPGLAPIWVHPALVEQAVFNVLENAARFSLPEEAVLVEARDVGGAVQVDVVDRGPGIPADERRRVFDMFYSVERGDRGGSRQGTGLGLAIAQGMVGAHGGSVEALPGDDGRGTRIRITLPRMTPAGSES